MLALLVVALGVALLTWVLGWWGVALAALVAGIVLWARRGVAWMVALAAAGGWTALLVFDALRGRFSPLATSVAGVVLMPPAVLVVVTLAFAALLGWSAAVIGSELARALRARSDAP